MHTIKYHSRPAFFIHALRTPCEAKLSKNVKAPTVPIPNFSCTTRKSMETAPDAIPLRQYVFSNMQKLNMAFGVSNLSMQ